MNKLNELNKYIYEEYKQLTNREELSIPLLILVKRPIAG